MPAIEVNVIEPVLQALQTQEGWIGLLLGLGGRETVGYIRSFVRSIRGTQLES